jgi:HPt (histidine-containing phosphotransfer) domain-containing protein
LLHKLVPKTERDMREALSRAAQALAQEQWDELRKEAHAAAGLAGFVGARRARDAAISLELSLERAEPPVLAVTELLRAWEQAWSEATAALRELAGVGDA